MEDAAVVFVHGLFSSRQTWNALRVLIESDPQLSSLTLLDFEYPSPKFVFNPLKRIPNYDDVADSLRTFLNTEVANYSSVALVTHSQGGLIAQRHLARSVMSGRAKELERIRCLAMFACPNSGSDIFRILRRLAFNSHPHERELRTINASVTAAQQVIINRILHSDDFSIQFHAYAGDQDNVVTPTSARGVFPETGVLPGDHFTIVKPDSAKHRTYLALRMHLLSSFADLSDKYDAMSPQKDVHEDTLDSRNLAVCDYLYVSARKVARIGRTVRPETWERIRQNRPDLYYFDPEIASNSDSCADDVISLVPQVEDLLRQNFGLTYMSDPELQVGQWFRVEDVPVVYGVPGVDIGGVLFVGEHTGVRLALGGSAEYLLDRPANHLVGGPWGYSASGLGGIRNLLRSIVHVDRRLTENRSEQADVDWEVRAAGLYLGELTTQGRGQDELQHSYESIVSAFDSGWQPVTALARCLYVGYGGDARRSVIGTPLYVALSVPR